MEGWTSLTCNTKSFDILNQTVGFSEVSSMIWHSTNIRYLTSVFPSKLFSLALSLLFCIIDHDWHYPFPAALLQYLPFFFFPPSAYLTQGKQNVTYSQSSWIFSLFALQDAKLHPGIPLINIPTQNSRQDSILASSAMSFWRYYFPSRLITHQGLSPLLK